jgi:hypothetical protein
LENLNQKNLGNKKAAWEKPLTIDLVALGADSTPASAPKGIKNGK